MRIIDCDEDCYTYLIRVRDMIKLYKKQVQVKLRIQFQVDQLDDVARENIEATIQRISGNELDKDLEVIKAIYKEVMTYGLDTQGCNKYNDMMKHDDVSREDTPFSVRIVTNDVVKGGLNYMLDEFDKTVSRIRKENPTRKVYYVRKEIKTNPNPKPNPPKEIQVAALNTTENKDKKDIELDKTLMGK